jgi:mechanosensitive ion channel-like protein
MTIAITYRTGVENAWSNIATFIPKLVIFLIILVVGYFIAKAIAKIVTRVLQKVGFDNLVERGGVRRMLADSDYEPATILSKIVFYAIMLFVLSTAFGVFGPNPISDYLHAIVAYLPLVFIAIIIVIIAAAIAAAVRMLIKNSLSGLSYANVLANSASGLIIAFGVIAALDQLHIATNVVNAVLYAALAAVVGVIIVAVGGGGIRTMSRRWELAAARYDVEKPRIAAAARNARPISEQVHQAARQEQAHAADSASGVSQTQPTPDSSTEYAQPSTEQFPPADLYRGGHGEAPRPSSY